MEKYNEASAGFQSLYGDSLSENELEELLHGWFTSQVLGGSEGAQA